MDEGDRAPPLPLDIEALLGPIGGDGGTGTELRFDPVYRTIQEARREENARLPRGIWVRDAKRADWQTVERLCIDVLRTRSKDLQVAAWLTEALLQRSGFIGLACGLRLLDRLCVEFWQNLHPAIEAADLDARVAPFEWLNARLPVLLRDRAIVQSAINPDLAYTWTNYANALLLEGLRQRDSAAVARSEAAGAVSIAAFNSVRDQTALDVLERLRSEIEICLQALADLNARLELVCGDQAPGLGAINETLRSIFNLICATVADRQPKPFAPVPRTVAKVVAQAASGEVQRAAEAALASAAGGTGDAMTREEAYLRLADLANALHRIEPQSPAPYLIRCAVAWADLSFAEVVTSFTRAGLDIGKVFNVLDLVTPNDSTES